MMEAKKREFKIPINKVRSTMVKEFNTEAADK